MTTAAERETADALLRARRLTRLRRWLALSWLALIAATWRLWTPQTAFPQIPFLGGLRETPTWVDWAALAATIAGLIGLLLAPDPASPAPSSPGIAPVGRFLRTSALFAVASTSVLVLLDQHRFQPWAYQFAVVALVLGFTPPDRAPSLLRVLTVGIYFWSAVSKLDHTFLHTLGPELLQGLLRALRLEPRFLRPEAAATLAWTFPIAELTVAALLAARRTRAFGLAAAVVMHLALIATLGPWGLDHSWGVLLWNAYFIGQNLLLFRRPQDGWRRTAGPGLRLRLREALRGALPGRGTVSPGGVAVYLAVWLPALEPFGWLDQWPAWAVYAPAGERVRLVVLRSDRHDVPATVRSFHAPATDRSPATFRPDLWSLETLAAPPYPAGRFHAGLAAAVAGRYRLGDDAALVVEGPADRFTGRRRRRVLSGDPAIRDFAESFRLNALPRPLGGW